MKKMHMSDKGKASVTLVELNSEGTLNKVQSHSLTNCSTRYRKNFAFLTRTLILVAIFFAWKWIRGQWSTFSYRYCHSEFL